MTTTLLVAAAVLLVLLVLRLIGWALAQVLRLALLAVVAAGLILAFGPRDGAPPASAPPLGSPRSPSSAPR